MRMLTSLKRVSSEFLVAVCVSFSIFLQLVAAQNIGDVGQGTSTAGENEKNLRDVFLGTDSATGPPDRTVGRLSILLKDGESFRQVRPDHGFKSGDRFRFSVASNRNGWLYIFHAASGEALKQLWPRDQDDNSVKAGATYEIPPLPGVFIFDNNTGQEYFYIAIRSNRSRPNLRASATKPAGEQPSKSHITNSTPKKHPKDEITNFVVRNPFGGPDRGVIFDPGKKDGSPYLYFSSVSQDDVDSAMVEFRLAHVQ